jgi:hypothetical protein
MAFLALAQFADLALAAAIATIFGLAFGQVYRPWQGPAAGETLRRVRLPFRARIRLHGVWLLGVALVLLGAATLGIATTVWPFLVAAVAAMALLACPVRYTLTDQGICVGRTALRRWTEFGGLSARNGWIYLQPVAGAKGLLIRAPERSSAGQLTAELRQLVRGAYKGQVGPYRGTVDWDEPTDDDRAPSGIGAAA